MHFYKSMWSPGGLQELHTIITKIGNIWWNPWGRVKYTLFRKSVMAFVMAIVVEVDDGVLMVRGVYLT